MATIKLFRHYIRIPFLILAIAEVIILIASVYAAAYLRFLGDSVEIQESVGPLLPRAILFSSIMLLSMLAMGLYQGRLREGLLGILLRVLVSITIGAIGLTLVFYIFPFLFLGRGPLFIALLVAFVGIIISRAIFLRVIDENVLKRHILILGAGEQAEDFAKLRRRSDQRGFIIVGFVHFHGERDVIEEDKVIHLDKSLLEASLEYGIDEIVIAVSDRRKNFPMHELLDCKLSGIDIVDAITFFERETGKILLELLHPGWLIFSEGYARGPFHTYIERSFDIITSSILLLFVWPLIAITAFAILAESGWGKPVLYRQVRIGQHGRPFQLLKFRSMGMDAENDGKVRWAKKNDTRITRIGSIIRKFRIDELPQIYNIFRGDMSFVGPRPERPTFVSHLAEIIPYYSERHRVKPGLAGWAQLCYPYGSSDKDAAEKLQYDLYYAKNHSFIFDLFIILQTVEVVIFSKGAQ